MLADRSPAMEGPTQSWMQQLAGPKLIEEHQGNAVGFPFPLLGRSG
jgi:hypothetical protein